MFKTNKTINLVMKIIHKDLKHNVLKLKPETIEDLYTLEKIILPDDSISGKTMRSMTIKRDEQVVNIGKKPVFIKLNVENVKFSESSNELRVNGKITEATKNIPHIHHTIEIKINEPITIEHKWKNYELEKINDSRIKKPTILICVLDDESCSFAVLNERLKFLSNIRGVSGKLYETKRDEKRRKYFEQIIDYIKNVECNNIILAGPGFAKDDLYKLIKDKKLDIIKKIFVDSVSYTGRVGINEVIKRGIINKIIKKSLITEQTQLVESFLEQLSKNGNVVYGLKETKNAIKQGAVDMLLISDELIRKLEELFEETEKMKTKIKIISSDHEAGKRFLNLGGIAGFLRWKVQKL